MLGSLVWDSASRPGMGTEGRCCNGMGEAAPFGGAPLVVEDPFILDFGGCDFGLEGGGLSELPGGSPSFWAVSVSVASG